jgi:hypothetical protein
MKHSALFYILLALVLLCVGLFLFRARLRTDHSKLPPDKLQSDLDFLYKQIVTIDPDPFINCSHAKTDSLYASIKRRITEPMTTMQYYRLLRPLVSSFDDGHLSIFPERDFAKFQREQGKVFPFEVLIDSGRLFIKASLQKNYTVVHGSEIVLINNIPAHELIKTLLTFFSGDSYPYKLKTVEENFAIGLWRAYGFKNNFQLVLADGTKLRVAGVAPVDKPSQHASLRLLKSADEQVALLTIPSLVIDNDKGFDRFLDSSFTLIGRGNIKHLIVDIRNNGGGSTLLARKVFDYITTIPYAVSREEIAYSNGRFVRTVDTTLTTPKQFKNKFTGKTILLMNSGTYSSSHMMANAFKYYHLGTTVGDSSCERMRISGEVNKIVLPASKLEMYCPSSVFILPSASDQRSRLIPDYLIPLTFTDRLRNHDSQLQFCLKLSAGN